MQKTKMLATEMQTQSLKMPGSSHIELNFDVIGQTLPADHGYGLYSAIAHQCSEVHSQEEVSILTISGKPDHQGKIELTRQSHLKIRLPHEQIMGVLPLAGKILTIGTHEIQLGIPRIAKLQPTNSLRSRIVVIKKFQDTEPFLEAVNRQLEALNIQGSAFIPLDAAGEPLRKAIKIKTYSVIGFSVMMTNLSDEDSIKLQACGLGGKHRMGCGIFTAFPHVRRFQDV